VDVTNDPEKKKQELRLLAFCLLVGAGCAVVAGFFAWGPAGGFGVAAGELLAFAILIGISG
jgi:hypothetical protein